MSGKPSMLHYSAKKGGWIGGNSRTLYAMTDRLTGKTSVVPGQGSKGLLYRGEGMTCRVARLDEAKAMWQADPIERGWTVDENKQPSASVRDNGDGTVIIETSMGHANDDSNSAVYRALKAEKIVPRVHRGGYYAIDAGEMSMRSAVATVAAMLALHGIRIQ